MGVLRYIKCLIEHQISANTHVKCKKVYAHGDLFIPHMKYR